MHGIHLPHGKLGVAWLTIGLLSVLIAICSLVPNTASARLANGAPTTLAEVNSDGFIGAGVLPITSDRKWVLLGKEIVNNTPVVDAFSGKRTRSDCPLTTAAKELHEESMRHFGSVAGLKAHLSANGNVSHVLVNRRIKNFTLFVTTFPTPTMVSMFDRFHRIRRQLIAQHAPGQYLEKTAPVWVRASDLKRAVSNAAVVMRRNAANTGSYPTYVTHVDAVVSDPRAGVRVERVQLRDSLIATLRGWYANTAVQGFQRAHINGNLRFFRTQVTNTPLTFNPALPVPAPLVVGNRPRVPAAPAVGKRKPGGNNRATGKKKPAARGGKPSAKRPAPRRGKPSAKRPATRRGKPAGKRLAKRRSKPAGNRKRAGSKGRPAAKRRSQNTRPTAGKRKPRKANQAKPRAQKKPPAQRARR